MANANTDFDSRCHTTILFSVFFSDNAILHSLQAFQNCFYCEPAAVMSNGGATGKGHLAYATIEHQASIKQAFTLVLARLNQLC